MEQEPQNAPEEAPEQVKHSLDLKPYVLALPHLLLVLENQKF